MSSQIGLVWRALLTAVLPLSVLSWHPSSLASSLAFLWLLVLPFGFGAPPSCLLSIRWSSPPVLVVWPATSIQPLMRSTPDPDVVDLELEFQGLSITVRGPSASAASFISSLSSAPASSEPPSTIHHDHPSAPEVSLASEALSQSQASAVTSGLETRAAILASFPPLPSHWIDSCEALSSRGLSGTQRGQRAWVAGNWARATVEGRTSSPNRSEQLPLPNRYWCVLSCDRLPGPAVFTSSRAFFRAIGRLEGSNTVCHAFPSQVEARIYFSGAAIQFPPPQN